MRNETFRTIKAMIHNDPLTDAQRSEIAEFDSDELIDNAQAAKILGVGEQKMRLIKIPRCKVTRFLRYKLGDVIRYRDSHMEY